MLEMMSMQTIGLIWIAVGVILIILEFIVPGGFVFFLGFSAVVVGGLSFFNVFDSVWMQFFTWAVFSLLLILILRSQVAKWFPALERYQPTTDYTEMYGKEVTVVSDVDTESEEGRVQFQGTSWKAKTKTGRIAAGEKAKIVGKQNITFIIEKSADR
ncbi:MAG: NfeD family protein [Spirochaetia bacterium]|nr:NfeD family protein [Spirochaetia bacterium]